MIEHRLSGMQWGVVRIPAGAQINMIHPASQHAYQIPFAGESHVRLVRLLIAELPYEERMALLPFLEDNPDLPYHEGPQG